MEINDTQLRMFAMEIGADIYKHNSYIYQDDEEMASNISNPIDTAQEIFLFLKGELEG